MEKDVVGGARETARQMHVANAKALGSIAECMGQVGQVPEVASFLSSMSMMVSGNDAAISLMERALDQVSKELAFRREVDGFGREGADGE